MPDNKRDDVPVTRSLLTDAALVATPVAIAAQPEISKWADDHIGQSAANRTNRRRSNTNREKIPIQKAGLSSAAASWKNPWGPPTLAPAILAATQLELTRGARIPNCDKLALLAGLLNHCKTRPLLH